MSQGELFSKPSDLEQALERCETDWQRAVIQEWARLHPEPIGGVLGYLGHVDLVPIPCRCVHCETPSLIIPQEKGEPATASYCICPRCSQPKEIAA